MVKKDQIVTKRFGSDAVRNTFVFLFFALFASVLFGCSWRGDSDEERHNTVYEYVMEHSRIEEDGSPRWLINDYLAVTESNGNVYHFDNDIPEDKRSDFIRNQNAIFRLLKEEMVDHCNIELYVLEGITSRAQKDEGTVYLDVSLNGNTEQILLTLQAIVGEYTNFGYLFALSDHIASKLGWQKNKFDSADPSVFQNKPILLNLVYPCFSESYVTNEEIAMCRSLAVQLLNKMNNVYEGEAAFQSEIEEYAREKRIDFHPTYLVFSNGGSYCPLKIRTVYLDIDLWSDYGGSCTLTEKSIQEDPMFNFDTMVEFWEYADSDISEVRGKFGYDGEGLIEVTICSIRKVMNGGDAYGGYFTPSNSSPHIELADIYAVTHEYTHYLDHLRDEDSTDDVNWCGEVLAVYYGKNMAYCERLVRAQSGSENVYTIDLLSKVVGETFDHVDDEILFQNIMTANQDNPRYNLKTLYNGRLSYGDYFVTAYGEAAFVQCMMCPSAASSVIGCKIEDTVDAWCLWLENFKK